MVNTSKIVNLASLLLFVVYIHNIYNNAVIEIITQEEPGSSRTPIASSAFQPENNVGDIYLFPGTDKKMNQIQTFDELREQTNLSNDLPVPRNLNILFLGDSLTRYMYLDLVYFLKHGSWVNPTDEPNFLLEKQHQSWNHFYNMTNVILKPYEECDCYRQEGEVKLYRQANLFENRYYRDEERNNYVTYLQKFGNDFMKSSWDVWDIHEPHGALKTEITDVKIIHWLKWVDTIEQFVCRMEPKPSVFIFNQGLWGNHDLDNVTLQGEVVEALRKCDILSIFKTTTKKVDEVDRNFAEYESQLCSQTDYCLDLTWTSMVPREMYWDYAHFKPPLYSYMNLELLSLLSSIGGLLE